MASSPSREEEVPPAPERGRWRRRVTTCHVVVVVALLVVVAVAGVVWHRHAERRFDTKVRGVESEARTAGRALEVGSFFRSDAAARVGEHPTPNPQLPLLSGASVRTYSASLTTLLIIYDVSGWGQHACVRIHKVGDRATVARGSCALSAPR